MLWIGIGIGRGGGVIFEKQLFTLRIVVGYKNWNINFVVVVVVVVVREEVEEVRRRRNVSSGSTDPRRKSGVGGGDGVCCCCCCCCCCCGKEMSWGREEDRVAAGGVVRKVWVSWILFTIRGSYKWRFELWL
jgi:hypothetical protein